MYGKLRVGKYMIEQDGLRAIFRIDNPTGFGRIAFKRRSDHNEDFTPFASVNFIKDTYEVYEQFLAGRMLCRTVARIYEDPVSARELYAKTTGLCSMCDRPASEFTKGICDYCLEHPIF